MEKPINSNNVTSNKIVFKLSVLMLIRLLISGIAVFKSF